MNSSNKVNDKRATKLENVLAPDYIPFLSGRPVRENVINNDDLLNLKIELNNNNSVDEFIESVFG